LTLQEIRIPNPLFISIASRGLNANFFYDKLLESFSPAKTEKLPAFLSTVQFYRP